MPAKKDGKWLNLFFNGKQLAKITNTTLSFHKFYTLEQI